jgi:hypothetical protein
MISNFFSLIPEIPNIKFFIFFISVKYSVVIGRSIYSLYKNPRCSLACCLSLVLTIDEVQSEARSMEGNSGWQMKTQLECGNEFEGIKLIAKVVVCYFIPLVTIPNQQYIVI